MEREEVAAVILRHLHRHGRIGGYMSFEDILRKFPSHLRGLAKEVCRELIKNRLLTGSKHHFGVGISLNKDKLEEIEALIKKYFSDYVF